MNSCAHHTIKCTIPHWSSVSLAQSSDLDWYVGNYCSTWLSLISISKPARVISLKWALISGIWWRGKSIFYVTVTGTGFHREPLLIVANAMSSVCMWKKNAVLILRKREQTKWIDMCKTDAYKYKQACDIRLFTRCAQSGAAQARYINGLGDISVCYPKGGLCVLCETELIWGPKDLQGQPELSAKWKKDRRVRVWCTGLHQKPL